MPRKIIAGLEIGTSKVCVAVGENNSDGPPRILGIGTAASPGVKQGDVVDFPSAILSIREAIADAERKTDVKIERVVLSVTGEHFSGISHRGTIQLPPEREVITTEDCQDVLISARDIDIPQKNAFLHSVLQNYYVDGQPGIETPDGEHGHKVEADYYHVHGILDRIKVSIRCAKEAGLIVEDVIFSGLASAQVMVTSKQKEMGALVIDIGGGTTEYVFYHDGVVQRCGVLPVGGVHITHDIASHFNISMARAERIKIQEGGIFCHQDNQLEVIGRPRQDNLPAVMVNLNSLNSIICNRMKKTMELLVQALSENGGLFCIGSGVFITGGTSQLPGIWKLAEVFFNHPVYTTLKATESRAGEFFANPTYSTVLGLVECTNTILTTPHGSSGHLFRQMDFRW